ncbi:cysteine proteinase [Lentithecium fluviatile CBS 122367]|uniref:Cysteine proteinase n=1 Tax=Lentithecium fluviatile CBS 122367 TaxID=1168545 RepID=A0A6G1J5X6_9PLEO|nr:cysteine proteinase [Lentithecium fluviatile CBS 122367]
MADKAAQRDAFKLAASNYQSQLQTAATKNEALNCAINAADNLMKALKLSSDPDEKKELKARFTSVVDAADRIKTTKVWSPLAQQSAPPPEALALRQRTNSEIIGQWAADVAHTAAPVADDETVFKSDSSRVGSSSTTAGPKIVTQGTSAASVPSSFVLVRDLKRRAEPLDPAHNYPRHDNPLFSVNHAPANTQPQDKSADFAVVGVTTASISRGDNAFTASLAHSGSDQKTQTRKLSCTLPSLASYSHIRRLAEPVSTRKRTKKEEIILLKASVIAGFKCPPWDKTPLSNEFVPSEAGPFVDAHDLSLSAYQLQFFGGWARAEQALPPPFMFHSDREGLGPVMSTSRSIDLVQDAATDCSVVASLCAGIARAERGHDQASYPGILSNKIYPTDKNLGKPVISSNGKYIVRLNFNGCWRKVVIDDSLPLSNSHRLLHVIDRRQPGLLWPALLEKAYLKVRGGYDFPGSNSCSDLWTLTGWIPEQVRLQETDTVPSQLWERVYKGFMFGDVLITLGTGKMSSRQERELGLEGQHSYVVLDMKETDHDRLLLVKNPWVEGKGWRGPRPAPALLEDSSTSSEPSKNSLEVYHRDSLPTKERPHPTTFWIGLEQVIRHFESLYLNWNPGLFKHRQDIHFEWRLDGHEVSGGCIVKNPQFSFWSKDAENVWFLLTRHFRDASDDKSGSDAFNDGSVRPDTNVDSSGETPKGFMSICVCDGKGQRMYKNEWCVEHSDYVTTPQCLLRCDTDSNSTYTVFIDQDELPVSAYTFTLSAFSSSKISLEPAIQKYPLKKEATGEWTRRTAGGGVGSTRYFENPQYMLKVKHKGPLAILLTSATHKNPLHVKLTLGHGKRVYRLQRRDVLVDSGDHSPTYAFAETEEVQPGVYTIICSLFEAGLTGDYTLRVDSTSEVELTQIPRDGAGMLLMKLAPACFGAEVHKIAAPLEARRLASCTIVARFLRSTTPRSMGLLPAARSPFRFSIERGRGPERQFVMASESGEYTDSQIVRCESFDLDPARYATGSLWLVLDRLSGPGGPVEEWYDVELFVDTPQACTVGVWRNWSD